VIVYQNILLKYTFFVAVSDFFVEKSEVEGSTFLKKEKSEL
jgi:hypothetical protein